LIDYSGDGHDLYEKGVSLIIKWNILD